MAGGGPDRRLAGLEAFVRTKQLTMPVYHDLKQEAGQAFNQWGTPAYYVVDTRGRIRFDYAIPVDALLAQAEVVRLEGARP